MTFWCFFLGTVLLVPGLFAVCRPVRAARFLVAFPRMTRLGWALCAAGWFLTARELDVIGIEIFDRYLKAFPGEVWILATVLTPLTCWWMANLLPIRGLAALAMLFPASLLPAVRLVESDWRLVPVSVAYACAAFGMFAMFYPWRVRQAFAWAAARPAFVRGAGAFLGALGGVLLALGACSAAGAFSARPDEAAARRALCARWGIPTDGRSEFVPLPPTVPHFAGRAALGAKLHNNKWIARSSRRTCGACHPLNEGGTDGKVHGALLTRSLFNAAFADLFLHDCSATGHAAAVARMISDPQFGAAGSPDAAAERLASHEPRIRTLFERNYETGLVGSNLVDAVVQYGRTLISPPTAFDLWCGGNTNAPITAVQRRGAEVFLARRCTRCHNGPALGLRTAFGGRKTPALRGLRLRRVYWHDGRFADLGAAVARMRDGDAELDAPDGSDRAAMLEFLKIL